MTISPGKSLPLLAVPAVLTALAGNVYADHLDYHFEFALSNGTQSASADFTFSDAGGGDVNLNIVLTNTMTTNGAPNWLTGLFFNLAGVTTPLAAPSAADGQMITLEGTDQTEIFGPTGNPANYWAYRNDLSGELPFGDQQYGLGSAGLDIFGLRDIINFGDIPDDILPQPAGSDGGILADIVGLEVPEGHEGRPFVLGSLEFTFLLEGVFDMDELSVSDIAFIFGTGFDETVLIPLPLPVAMAGAGLMMVVFFRRRLVALAGR